MSIGIIIQARSGSKRLPRKIYRKVGNGNFLEFILKRISKVKKKYTIVIGTTNLKEDDKIEHITQSMGFLCFRGDVQNVLKRYYECAEKYKFKHIIRLTGDNPFFNITEINRLANFHIREGNDYSSNLDSLPIGAGTEIFKKNTLFKIVSGSTKKNHKEHINEYILENKKEFKIGILKALEKNVFPEYRLTVDTYNDLKKIRNLINNNKKFYKQYVIDY